MKHLKLFELRIEKTFIDWLKNPSQIETNEYILKFPVRKNWRFIDTKFNLKDVDDFTKRESGISIIDSISRDMDLDHESVLANESEIYEAWLEQEWEGKRNHIRFLNTFGLNFSESCISDDDFTQIKNSFNSSSIHRQFDSRAFGGTFNMISIEIRNINKSRDQISIFAKSDRILNEDQRETLKDFLTGQLADEWGDKYSKMNKKEKRNKLDFNTNIDFYWGVGYPDWKITIE